MMPPPLPPPLPPTAFAEAMAAARASIGLQMLRVGDEVLRPDRPFFGRPPRPPLRCKVVEIGRGADAVPARIRERVDAADKAKAAADEAVQAAGGLEALRECERRLVTAREEASRDELAAQETCDALDEAAAAANNRWEAADAAEDAAEAEVRAEFGDAVADQMNENGFTVCDACYSRTDLSALPIVGPGYYADVPGSDDDDDSESRDWLRSGPVPGVLRAAFRCRAAALFAD